MPCLRPDDVDARDKPAHDVETIEWNLLWPRLPTSVTFLLFWNVKTMRAIPISSAVERFWLGFFVPKMVNYQKYKCH